MSNLNSFILQSSNISHLAGEWVFQMKDDPKEVIIKKDWYNRLLELNDLVLIMSESFSIQNNLCILNCGETVSGFETNYNKYFNPQDLLFNQIIEDFLEILDSKLKIDFNYRFSIKLNLSGNLSILNELIFFQNLFTITAERSSSIAFRISTNNFAFLPHNPITKQKHYNIWKENAPKLAHCLQEFSNKTTDMQLISEIGDSLKYGSISENPFYLSNNAIVGVDDPDFDEFYIPFDLI